MIVLALQFANGNVFFAGLLLSVSGTLLIALFHRRITRSLVNVVTLSGALFVLLSATPLPAWLYILWLVLFVTAHAFMAQLLLGLMYNEESASGLQEENVPGPGLT